MQLNDRTNNSRIYLIALLVICGLIKVIMVQYGLPYGTHVDESDIIKDPLKILLQYKEGSFQTSTNLFNHIIVAWHAITFVVGLLAGYWKSAQGYLDALSMDSAAIVLSFRILCALLSTVGIYAWLKLLRKILPGNFSGQFLIPLLFVLNPVEINSDNFTKYDAVSFLFYALEFYCGYHYFILKEQKFRKYIYFIPFLAVSARIEHVAFLIGYSLLDFWKVYRFDFKKYFDKELIKYGALSLIVYLVVTLNFIYFFNPGHSIYYTKTKTFEEGIVHFSQLKAISYSYYFKTFFYLFSPALLLLILMHFIDSRFTEKKDKFYFLVIPFLIITSILALVIVKNVHYYSASSCFILFIGLTTIPSIKNKVFQWGILLFVLLYFLSYDFQLVKQAAQPTPNGEVRKFILQHTSHNDRIVTYGIADLRILDEPHTIAEQLQALKEVGGSTGLGLKNFLKLALADSSDCRDLFIRVPDYFWKNTKYENRWFIGMEISRLHDLQPKYIVVFEREEGMHKAETDLYNFLKRDYTLVHHKPYIFHDPRLFYRNFYYFHSASVYEKKEAASY